MAQPKSDKRHRPSTKTAFQRSAVYALLATFFRKVPSLELVEGIRRPGVLEALRNGGMVLDRHEWLANPPREIAEKLAVDYTALFIAGSGQIPLNESAHRSESGEYWGEPALKVRAFFESLGLSIDENWTGLYDHLAVELEIMRLLTRAEGRARADRRRADAVRCRKLQSRFFQSHLDGWVVELCARVMSRAKAELYRELARTTRAFMKQEYTYLITPTNAD